MRKATAGNKSSWFSRFTKSAANTMGHPNALGTAFFIVVAWGVSGPLFGFSDTWQLVINTGTTIITFLMVFVIQNTQNRDSTAVQLKLDELLRCTRGAHNAILDVEELSQEELEKFRCGYSKLARDARKDLKAGVKDTGIPDI